MRSPLLISLLSLGLLSVPLFSQDTDPAADGAKLPTNVETVVTGGHWERGDQDGTYRVIMLLEGWEHLANRVLLQWIRYDQDKQEMLVEKTVAIEEIPVGAAWRITSVNFVTPKDLPAKGSKATEKQGQLQLVLQAHSERAGKATFTITPTTDHRYAFLESLK
ncbi:hypothetical protein [Roseimicrobium sp. ORNL1]|uniref:hypothetical protein n=1 Tax=Roseimicrobium sp. ORNL1 TaxID=2711231 RepID=UPI0013E16975|nr:hypothetical protein [Roseimicrobium sp. ORNL1]QIF03410.1 hypothetical protein G5S37_18380 [Roseimicrobium sp. ORNL1]